MAKAKLNSALAALSGQLDGLVFKHYADGVVVSRQPRMDKIKPSAKQIAQRERFRAAAGFHREVLANAALKRKYQATATKKGVPLSAVTMAAFMAKTR